MAGKGQSESIEAKSDRLASMLDSGQGKQVINQLRQEFDSMSPREYSRFVREIAKKEDKSVGANLKIVMSGKAELVLVDDGRGRATRSPGRPPEAPPLSLADMRQKSIDKNPCARYEDLRLNQLADISRQYAAKSPLLVPGQRERAHSPVVIDVAAQKRLQQVAAECKLTQKKYP